MKLQRLALACALAFGLGGAACGVDAESNTGLLLVVTVDESAVTEQGIPEIAVLRFYLATKVSEDPDTWVLNEALAGRPVDVLDRDLQLHPYRLFIAEDGDGSMETVRVLVVGEKDGQPVLMGAMLDPEHQTLKSGKIVSRTIRLRPEPGFPALTWTRTGCLLSADGTLQFGSLEDQDCDGYVAEAYGGDDCNDQDASINPAADDTRDCDGKDNDCDGVVDPGGWEDNDGDGVAPCEDDCDDNDIEIFPGQPEVCDGRDNNCNGKCDEGMDEDGDGYTPCKTFLVNGGEQCVGVLNKDCDDANADIHPNAEELADGRDNNCNGLCDENTDGDGDGYNTIGSMDGEIVNVEPGGLCTEDPALIDCKDDDPTVHPGALELCDGVNSDCNHETVPPDVLCYAWASNPSDSACMAGYASCNDAGSDAGWGECIVDVATAEVEPAAYCAAWDLCAGELQPDLCLSQRITEYDLACDVTMWTPGVEPCVEDPPVYFLPFGFSGMTGNCTWYLQLDYNVPGWYLVGLVDPTDTDGIPTTLLNSCEAALVARPMFDGAAPNTISGTISFVDQSGPDPYLLVIPFDIDATTSEHCNVPRSMDCNLTQVAPVNP